MNESHSTISWMKPRNSRYKALSPDSDLGWAGQLLSRFCGMSHGYNWILLFLSSGVFPISSFDPSAALHSSSVGNRYSLSYGRSPALCSRFVNHLQNSCPSFQLTPTRMVRSLAKTRFLPCRTALLISVLTPSLRERKVQTKFHHHRF